MKIESKIVVCSILAIAIGIATIVPLAFLMSPVKAQANNEDTPWFNLKIPYAYYSASIQTGIDGNVDGIGAIHDLISYYTRYSIGFRWTTNRDAVNTLAEARLEYYQLQIYSDQGQIENMTTAIGVNSTNYVAPDSFHFERKGWFNTTVTNGASFVMNSGGLFGFFSPEINTGLSSSDGTSGALANTTLPEKFLNLQNAHTVYIDVYRLGYVTFNDNSTVVTLANDEIVQHIELTKNGDHFIYGNVPQIPPPPYFPPMTP